jgi:hypothetical protein
MVITGTPNVLRPTEVHHVDVEKSFERIKNGKSSDTVKQIRRLQENMDTCDRETEQGDKDYKALKKEKDRLKRELPSWSYSGRFNGRKNEGITESSGLMVLDFDGINVDYAKTELKQRDYIYAVWTSPSGNGVKALAKIKPTVSDSEYKEVYQQIEYDLKYLNIDEQCKDISRACFESYDPEIYINEQPKEFEKKQIDVMKGIRGMIFKSSGGKLHEKRIAAGHYAGGLVSEGLITYEEALEQLTKAVIENGTTDEKKAVKDLEDGLKKGMTKPLPKELIPKIQEPKQTILDEYPALSFIAEGEDDKHWLKRLKAGELKVGLTTGFDSLDKYFNFKEGKFNVVLGRANVGKSTVIWFLMVLANRLHGWKWIVFSAENSPAIIKKELMQFICGNFLDMMTEEEIDALYPIVEENFKIIKVDKMITAKELMMLAEETMKLGEFKGMLIDPYNALRLDLKGSSAYNYHYETVSEFKLWSERNNCTIFLNCHTGTAGARKLHQSGEFQGYPMPPDKSDIENGVMFENKADDFIVIHRYVQHPELANETHWHQVKVKETWSGGKPTPLEEPVKLTLGRKNGFNSFHDEYGHTPLREKYQELKTGNQEKSVFDFPQNIENPF